MNDTGKRARPMLNPPHLGELVRESMDEVGWNVTQTAARLGCERGTLSRLLNGKAGVSANMALALEAVGWGTADHWMRMQASYELARARRRHNARPGSSYVSASALLILAVTAAACAGADAGSQTENVPSADADAETQAAANRLSAEEAAEGFELLFDGESVDAWRGFQMDDVPAGWSAKDGALAFTPGVGGGTLITRDTYTDFDLRLEWKVDEGGNSGIFFGIVESTESAFQSGPEMQVLDNAGHYDGGDPLTSAGSNYGLHAPPEDVTRPVGEWNEVRIVRHGNQVVHWLNGVQVVEYQIASPEWEALVAGSKFIQWPDYGRHHEGHLGLQDHGDPVWYRNIRVRRIPS